MGRRIGSTVQRRTRRGRLLERVRLHFKRTQRQMAKAMGVDPATLNQWETGATKMPDARLDTLLLMVLDAEHDAVMTPRLLAAIREER